MSLSDILAVAGDRQADSGTASRSSSVSRRAGDPGELLPRTSTAAAAWPHRLRPLASCQGPGFPTSLMRCQLFKAERNVLSSNFCAPRESPDLTWQGQIKCFFTRYLRYPRKMSGRPKPVGGKVGCVHCVYQPWQKQSHLEDSCAFRISKGTYSIWNMMIMYDTAESHCGSLKKIKCTM